MKDKMLEIIKYNGVIPQLKHFNSEVFELNEAVFKAENYEPYDNDSFDKVNCNIKYYIEHIAEEMADCFNFLIQFCLYYGISKEDIMKILEYKVDRTHQKVQNGEKI